jgi:iron complex transport system substrate-binding protein
MPAQRICSLLPSATEIVYALGLGDRLVAVTHECDYPPEAAGKPRVTASAIDSAHLSARAIDEAVRASLAEQSTIYHLDGETLDGLRPDLILTQDLCTVCAVGTDEVRTVVRSLGTAPQVVSLEPRTLGDVLDSILAVGRLTGELRRALDLVDELRARLDRVRRAVAGLPGVSVLTLEWVDPLFVGGHWVPEMVELAGGVDVIGRAGHPSREVGWADVESAAPDVVVAMPCGFGLERSQRELAEATLPAEWSRLPAVRDDRVYVVDGSSYFNRPGPRLVDGVEILASILHPEAFDQSPPGSWARFESTAAVSRVAAGGRGADGDADQEQGGKCEDQGVTPLGSARGE